MVSKEEKKIVEKFQFYDKYGRFPEDRVRIDITLPIWLVNKLRVERIRTKKPVSVIVEESLSLSRVSITKKLF